MARTVSVSAEIKKHFLTEEKVRQKLKKKEQKALARAGGYVRKVARSSIRFRKKKKSVAGKPPFYHVKGKGWSIRTILFGYDEKHHSIIIGPVKFPTLGVVPEVLELGADNHPFEFLDNKKEIKVSRGNYKPRPFMGPALKTSKDKVSEFFKEM